MEVIIYAFFIVTGIAGLSYYTIRNRYGRLLEEEREKTFSLRNSELHLASEKQRLESALKEKEQQIADTQKLILTQESKSVSLSGEVLSKDKQIQSLTAQLQRESEQRASLEKELNGIEQQLSEFRKKVSAEETRTFSLSSDVTSKEQKISTLSAELQRQLGERSRAEEALAAKEKDAAALIEQIKAEEEQRAALTAEMTAKEQQFQDALTRQTMELQQRNDRITQEIEERRSAEARSQETIRELQHQVEQLQNELSTARSLNESFNTTREQQAREYQIKEEQLRQQLVETELFLTITKQDLEKTAEMLQEQTSVREATEHALQESKQKLYALISELEHKIAEQANAIAALQSQLRQTAADLDAADQSIHNILRNLPIPVFVVNGNGVCEYGNAALEELVGYGMSELADKHFSRLLPEDERGFYEEQWKNTDNRAEQFQGETRIIAATGDAISAAVSFVDIHPNGGSVKYVGFIMDRTTEKESQQHYAAAKEREKELQDLKSRFIGMVSNQLRTSLVTIATNTELLERFLDKWSDERRYHSFLRINESIRQMIELVRDVNFTTRASADKYTLTPGSVNLEAILQTASKELTADLESHHHFILSEKGDLTLLTLDETLVKTIVHQLLSNAFKYSRDNTEVRAHIEQSNGSCIIRIADQGIGIPAAEQKHLFSSFFRASNVSNIYGTGLGLTIVQQCVQLHGGTVAIESELNKGTTVTVTLPIVTIN